MAFDEDSFAEDEAARALRCDGRRLTPVAAKQLEQQLVREPNQPRLRCLLIGFYDRGQRGGAHAAERLNAHLGWLIDHRPDHPVLQWPVYPHRSQDEVGWQANHARWDRCLAVELPALVVFKRAAFFFLCGATDREREVIERAIQVHPDAVWGHAELGRLLLTDARFEKSSSVSRATAAEALTHLDRAVERGDANDQNVLLESQEEAARLSGNHALAESFALQMLDQADQHHEPGEQRYEARRRLGHTAWDRGDLKQALHQLAEAGGAWNEARSVYGPCFSLAQLLLQEGHRDAVRCHLEDVRERWTRGREQIDEWLALMKQQETPDLTARRR